MSSVDSLNGVSSGLTPTNWVAIGSIAATILGALILLIFRSGKVMGKIEHVDADIHNLQGDIKRIDAQVSKISGIEQRLDSLWKSFFSVSRSPMQLNERGLKVLEESGIKKIVENRFDKIVADVKALNPQNAYEVQESITKIVEQYAQDDSLKDALQTGAFKSGVDIFTVLFSGSIYIRDRVLSALGFNVDDIDKYQPK
jgi:hypothetical protein